MHPDRPHPDETFHYIYILSGGVGASAEQVIHTVLAQFPRGRIQVITIPNVRFPEQVDTTINQVRLSQGTLVHTLVDSSLRAYTIERAASESLTAIDLMGPLLGRLEQVLQQPGLGQPGLYRKLNKSYFDRIAAIDFAIAQDDGKAPENLPNAEIVLTGVSHVGKTPLSMYLAVLGWKTANVPLVFGIDPPAELAALDRAKVFGLTIDPAELMELREQRRRRMGAPGLVDYVDPVKIYEELQAAEELFKRNRFTVIDVTDKPIETNADEIIRIISSRFRDPNRSI